MRFSENYRKNRQALDEYKWWGGIGRNYFFSDDDNNDFQIIDLSDNNYTYKSKGITSGKIYNVDYTKINTRPFFTNLSKPILVCNEMNRYNLEYLYDNVRRSEDYGADNHIYLAYDSVDEFRLFLSVVDISDLMKNEKFFFLIGEEDIQNNYPFSFFDKYEAHYDKTNMQPIRVDEINRIIYDWPVSFFSGNEFMAGILDNHPNILTVPRFGMSGFQYVYEILLKNKTVDEAYELFQISERECIMSEFAEMFRCEMEEDGGLVPNIEKFWDCLRTIFPNNEYPSEKDWHTGFFLAYAMSLGRDMNNRISPIIRITNHQASEIKINWSEKEHLWGMYKYKRIISVIRNPLIRKASGMEYVYKDSGRSGINRATYQFSVPFSCIEEMKHRISEEDFFPSCWVRSGSERLLYSRIVRFEDLKLKPVETLLALCAFLDIPWDGILLKTTKNGKESGMKIRGRKEIKNFDPGPATNLHEDYMSKYDYCRMELLQGNMYSYWGYDREFSNNHQEHTLDEYLGMFKEPFRFEKTYIYKDQIKEIEKCREEMLEQVKKWYEHKNLKEDYDEDCVPIQLLKPLDTSNDNAFTGEKNELG